MREGGFVSALPDDHPLEETDIWAYLYDILEPHGFKTVGDVRAKSDAELRALPKIGVLRVAHLRAVLGPANKP